LVEEYSSGKQDQKTGNGEIINISHFPKDGGMRVLSVTKAKNGGYLLRIGYYHKAKKINEQQVMRLDSHEIAYLAVKLLGLVLNNGV
jgi:aspartate carbamoyltransferase regulatory subunit